MKKILPSNWVKAALALGMLSGILGFLVAQTAPTVRPPYASDKPMPEPVLFEIPEAISVDSFWHTWHTTMTPDGNTFYFMSAAGSRLEVIMETHFLHGKWSTPEVAPFSGMYWMESPSVSPDGRRFFFDKPNERGADIWVMDKTDQGWSEPRDLGAPVNKQGAAQVSASAAANGNLYFFSNRDGREMKIYRALWDQSAYREPERLDGAINAYDAAQPAIAPDESFLVFSSNRAGGLGGGDLYISYRQNGAWTPARNLGPKINSKAWEGRPYVSPDGKYLFFTSSRGFGDRRLERRVTYSELRELLNGPLNGRTNIYQVDITAVFPDGK